MTDAFEANYKSVLAKINPGFFPSKTQPAASGGHYTWASSDGWTAGFFPGLLWQLANIDDGRPGLILDYNIDTFDCPKFIAIRYDCEPEWGEA